ncbi:MAG: HPr family phosphocarrier protein [Candidatus Saccharimonas sp.]|nr:HPr family phosphocarrier protein [Planctomycetaceae bacterium]
MRPLELIARKAQSFQSQIHVIRGSNRVDAKSLLHLLTLGAESGMELEVEANGDDASGAVEQIVQLIESDFEMFEQPVRV